MPEGYVAADGNCLFASFAHLIQYHGMESMWGDMGNLNDRDVERLAAVRLRQRVAEYFDTRIDIFNKEWHVSDARDELRRQKNLSENENNPDFVNLNVDEPSPLYILRSYGNLVMSKDRVYSEKIEIDVAAELFNVIIDRYDVPLEVTYEQLYGGLPPRGTVPWGAATLNQTFTPQGQTPNTKRWTIAWRGNHFWWVPTAPHSAGTSGGDSSASGKKKKADPLPFVPAAPPAPAAPVPSPPSIPQPPVAPYATPASGKKRSTPPPVIKGDSMPGDYERLFDHAYSSQFRDIKKTQPTWEQTLGNGSQLRALADRYRADPNSWPLELQAAPPAAAAPEAASA